MEIAYENLQITDFERVYFGGFSLPKSEKTARLERIAESGAKRTAEFEFGPELEKISKKSFEIRPISPSRAVY